MSAMAILRQLAILIPAISPLSLTCPLLQRKIRANDCPNHLAPTDTLDRNIVVELRCSLGQHAPEVSHATQIVPERLRGRHRDGCGWRSLARLRSGRLQCRAGTCL